MSSGEEKCDFGFIDVNEELMLCRTQLDNLHEQHRCTFLTLQREQTAGQEMRLRVSSLEGLLKTKMATIQE
jgi:hypothetical protein